MLPIYKIKKTKINATHSSLFRFFLDQPTDAKEYIGESLKLSGWAITDLGCSVLVYVKGENSYETTALNAFRPDIQKAFPEQTKGREKEAFGFNIDTEDSSELEIGLLINSDEVAMCHVVRESTSIDGSAIMDQCFDHSEIDTDSEARVRDFSDGMGKELAEAVFHIRETLENDLKSAETNGLLSAFRKSFGVPSFALLKKLLNENILYPNQRELTHHGVMKTFRFWAPSEIDYYFEDVSNTLELLNQKGFPAFSFYGTLLGIIRDRAFIQHDDDIDVTVVLPSKEGYQSEDYVREMVDLLEGIGLKVSGDYKYHRHAQSRSMAFDVFLAVENKSTITFYGPNIFTTNKSNVYPMFASNFLGSKCHLPRNPFALLEHLYGAGWVSPDPNFYEAGRHQKLNTGVVYDEKDSVSVLSMSVMATPHMQSDGLYAEKPRNPGWGLRKEQLKGLFANQEYDFIGFQHCSIQEDSNAAELFTQSLNDSGRPFSLFADAAGNDHFKSDFVPILYRSDLWSITDDRGLECFETQRPENCEGGGGEFFVYARFEKNDGRQLYVYNVRLRHAHSEELDLYRIQCLDELFDHALNRQRQDAEVVFLTDTNVDVPDCYCDRYLLGETVSIGANNFRPPIDIRDSFIEIYPDLRGRVSTQHNFGADTAGDIFAANNRNDRILSTGGLEVTHARIRTDNVNGLFPSYHYPIEATLSLPALSDH